MLEGERARLANEVYQHDTARTVLRSQMQRSETMGASTGKDRLYTLVPAHDAGGKAVGVTIYTIDEVKQRANAAGGNGPDVTH